MASGERPWHAMTDGVTLSAGERSMGLDGRRVAEVMCIRRDGSAQRGSGYRVRDRLVLTAAHVVSDVMEVTVRFDADQPGEWSAPTTVAWCDPSADVVLLRLERVDGPSEVVPVRFGRLARRAERVEAHLVGFPRWKLRRYPDGSRIREAHHAVGTVAGLSNPRSGTLEITVDPPAEDPDLAVSPWEAMSGTAVWVADHIVGVVSAHHRQEGLSRLTAVRLESLENSEPASILGFPDGAEVLADVLALVEGAPTGPSRARPSGGFLTALAVEDRLLPPVRRNAAFTHVDAQLAHAVGMVRSFGALVVIGAEVSSGRYPMTAQLPPLLWQAIDDVPDALAELRARMSAPGSAKEILSSGPDVLQVGWQIVREFPLARRAFQTAFAALDSDREPSGAHFDLARLVNTGHVEVVVSYNWDTCLERAHERMYGVGLPAGLLHKPHGDAARPHHDDWVLPDEDGQVPTEVLNQVVQLSDRPRTLVVVGYGGRDAAVVESLLAPLEKRWPVVRVGLSATGEGAIASTADSALAALASQLAPPEPFKAWKYVAFLQSRSFLAALRGERLRPTDVEACPELPAAPRLAERLLASRFATLSGSSGTGKSVTAFHAARRLNRQGWKVIELKQAGVASAADVEEFRRLNGPVLAVVDDAQAIDRGVVADFESSADDTHAILLVSTERLEARDDETLLAAQSMQVLHEYCRANIEMVGPLLTQLDDRVRWSVFSDTPEQRLDLAVRTATEPWLYMFVASGGERRIIGALDRAVEDVAAALVLAFICIAQMTSRDAGVTREELVAAAVRHASIRFAPGGVLQRNRIDRALFLLTNEKLIREHDGRIRAAHIRIAERALQNLGQRETAEIGPTVRACVRAALLDDAIEVAGKFWLFRVFERMDVYRYQWANSIVDEAVSAHLLHQCLAAAPGSERGVALNLVWASEWLRQLSDTAADELADSIIRWLPDLTSDEVNGYRWTLSGLRSRHEAAYVRIRDAASARAIAERLSVAGSRRAASDWTHIIQELRPDWRGGDLLAWSDEFENAIDAELLIGWLSDRDSHSHPFEVYELINALASIAPQTAKIAFEACGGEIRGAMERDLADAASNFASWVFGTMTIVAMLADAPSARDDDEDHHDREPDESDAARSAFMNAKEPALRELAASVLAAMKEVDWRAAARSLDRKKRHQLHNLDLLLAWLAYLSTDITDEIAIALSSNWLLRIVGEAREEGGMEGSPYGAIDYWLYHLSWGGRGKAVVRGFLAEYENEIKPLPSILVRRYPDLAVQSIRNGRASRFMLHAAQGGPVSPQT
ncbi:trypsin-like peptidase domain-containing protein [Micromonospora sp. NPDC049240]|uniref:trypsin-like peptidase domain-containing protein n=1 Tax=Micromonospora sp. NPDC049240 TaxID=3155151 RepID=UPI0034071990